MMGQPTGKHLAGVYKMFSEQGNTTGAARTAKQLAALGLGTDGKPAKDEAAAKRRAAAQAQKPAEPASPAAEPEPKADEPEPARSQPPTGRQSPRDRQSKG